MAPHFARRYLVLAAVAVLLAATGIVYLVTRDDDDVTAFCDGLVSAADIESLTPESRYRGRMSTEVDESCTVHYFTDDAGGFVDYILYSKYDSVAGDITDHGLDPGVKLAYPLGKGLVGLVTDSRGMIEIPPCREGDNPRYLMMVALEVRSDGHQGLPSSGLTTPDKPVQIGNHVMIAPLLVRIANAINVRDGCTTVPLPSVPEVTLAEGASQTPETAFDPATLCGRSVAGLGLAARPGLTQRWTGTHDFFEDCHITDSTRRPETGPSLRLEIQRGRLAQLEPAYTIRGGMIGPPLGRVVPTADNGALYEADCERGRVRYDVLVDPAAQLGDPVALLRAVVEADAARNGCPPLPA